MDKSETLKLLYADIKAHTADGSVLYDRIRYVEAHGHLPAPAPVDTTATMDMYQIKDRIKQLNDVICKTKRKLEPSAKPAKADKVLEWQMKLDEALMEREEMYQLKKRQQYGE